jgi:N-acetylglucosaminyldiphosphoundecaprenol N-acetyl-beta-D-mannosaminyltransferase
VWALRALGHEIGDRVYGPTLMERACERAARTGTRFYLYGGRDQAALEQLERRLCERFPGLTIAGSLSPPFRPLSADEERDAIAAINASRADVVWVGIGVPKQEAITAPGAGPDRRRCGLRLPRRARAAGAAAASAHGPGVGVSPVP